MGAVPAGAAAGPLDRESRRRLRIDVGRAGTGPVAGVAEPPTAAERPTPAAGTPSGQSSLADAVFWVPSAARLAGNRRMSDRTSGFGASSATSSSISRFERWTARASS
jgi:hypothetical protein